jgi:hypothetical protein
VVLESTEVPFRENAGRTRGGDVPQDAVDVAISGPALSGIVDLISIGGKERTFRVQPRPASRR